MSDVSIRGLLVFSRDAQRRAGAMAIARASGMFAPVRVASQLSEAAKCFADTAVQVVVVVDDQAATDALRAFTDSLTWAVDVYHCGTVDDVRRVLRM